MSALARRWPLLVALAGVAAMGGAARAADYDVRAFAQPSGTIGETQEVQLVIRIQGGGNADVAPPAMSGLVNLDVLGGPSRRMSSIWNNGRFSTTIEFVYTLVPRAPGPAEVPAFAIAIDGETYRTAAIRFAVEHQGAGAPRSVPNPSSAPRPPPSDTAPVFLRATLGARDVWVGQSVPLNVELYTATQIGGTNWIQQPGLASFWAEEVEVHPEAEAYATQVDGERYTVYPLIRKILVPQATGDARIDPFALQMQARGRARGGGDPFDLFFNLGRTESIVRKTEALTLHVRPLPEEGRPAEFGGAVGTYTLAASLDRNAATVNEALSLTVTVDGQGSLRAVEAPVIDAPPDLKTFDPKVTATSRVVSGQLVSRKTWEWVLVPLAPGEMGLPSVRFAYFDPKSGRYAVAHRDLPTLVVRKGANEGGATVARGGDIQVQRRDLAYIKPLSGRLARSAARVHRRPGYLVLAGLPLVWVPLLVVAGRFRAKLQRNQGLARSRRARARTRRRLKGAHRHLQSLDGAQFHEEVALALVEYVADRFDRSAAGLTYDGVDDLLTARQVDATLRRRFRACLETCDFARFVPAAAESERKAELWSEATALVDELERAL